MKNNIVWFNGYISREQREELHGHLGCLIWLTGLSASGKSTIAQVLEKELYNKKFCSTYVLDGDNVRHGLCGDLGFSPEDRTENIRRIGEMAKLFIEAGIITITAFISPYKEDREKVCNLVGKDRFIEIFVDCPLDVCKIRDPKGIYKKVEQGIIKNFTGVDAPYEKPDNPNIHLKTDEISVEESVKKIMDYLMTNKIIEIDNRIFNVSSSFQIRKKNA